MKTFFSIGRIFLISNFMLIISTDAEDQNTAWIGVHSKSIRNKWLYTHSDLRLLNMNRTYRYLKRPAFQRVWKPRFQHIVLFEVVLHQQIKYIILEFEQECSAYFYSCAPRSTTFCKAHQWIPLCHWLKFNEQFLVCSLLYYTVPLHQFYVYTTWKIANKSTLTAVEPLLRRWLTQKAVWQ